ncbi:MAG: ABC transporter permease, partial [Parabacteroides sp.]|nr:ABC transporter permease [Parabacteroides sp.]
MKEEHKLSHIIKEGFQDMFYIWKDELKQVFRDEGIMIFFFLVPLVYPVLYAYIYNNEVVHEAKMVVVDQSNSPLSREFIRRVDASSEVHVVQVVGEMEEARRLVDSKEAFGILSIPSAFSKDLHQGRQTTVSLYSDMSALLFYKAFLLTATEVSLEMGSEWTVRNHPQSTEALQAIAVQPIPSESISMYNPQNGFASFLVPAILILVIQQTLILGIGMSAGTAREKNRFHTLVPITKHFHGTLRIVLGKSLTYIVLYVVVCAW